MPFRTCEIARRDRLYTDAGSWLSSPARLIKPRPTPAEANAMDDEDGDGFDIVDTPEKRALKARLGELRHEHRALDSAIAALQETGAGDALQLARLKRNKLVLRDQIKWIEDRLTPDIIA
jgi:hypothetical protein